MKKRRKRERGEGVGEDRNESPWEPSSDNGVDQRRRSQKRRRRRRRRQRAMERKMQEILLLAAQSGSMSSAVAVDGGAGSARGTSSLGATKHTMVP